MDLIDRKCVLSLSKDVELNGGCKHRCIDAIQIYELPSIQLIYCEDCKYWKILEYGVAKVPTCTRLMVFMDGDGFCNFAKRREDGFD